MNNESIISKVLIIDDEGDIREIIQHFLKAENIDTVGVSNISDAFKALRNEDFTAILCDMSMPGGTGIEFLTQVRKEGRLIPITFVSAYDTKNYLIDALRLNAFDYIVKPFSPQELADVTFRMLEVGKILSHIQRNINNLNLGMDELLKLQKIYPKIGQHLANNFQKRTIKKAA
ncbi:MAG: response regulator [Bacteriovoracaceae bacterium]|nr:response regulator [Bacteriovoracaceae bacterium]